MKRFAAICYPETVLGLSVECECSVTSESGERSAARDFINTNINYYLRESHSVSWTSINQGLLH